MFTYDQASTQAIIDTLSSDRLAPYLTSSSLPGDPAAALELYVWNAGISGALFGPLQAVEVGIRNAIHREMTLIFNTPTWYSERAFKKTATYLVGDLVETASRLVKEAKPVDAPHLLAGLHFGFWTQLLGSGPNGNFRRHFWNAGLYQAFQHYPNDPKTNHGKIRGDIIALKAFRNRVAHHEPIHNKNPQGQYDRIIRVAGWLDPKLPLWIEKHSRCQTLLLSKPHSSPGF